MDLNDKKNTPVQSMKKNLLSTESLIFKDVTVDNMYEFHAYSML